ncbi:hypothetical protein ACE6H2_004957 [Prunus campanulata]
MIQDMNLEKIRSASTVATQEATTISSRSAYHFVIPADYKSGEQLNDPFDKDDYFFKDWTHLLHGLLHNNGIGHLICINGINGGSAFITSRDIMHLWDLRSLYF